MRRDRDGNGVLEYAQKFASSPGKHDGLYWPARPGREPARTALCRREGPGEGYHGYHFKILKAQGKDAPGGAYDYVIGDACAAASPWSPGRCNTAKPA